MAAKKQKTATSKKKNILLYVGVIVLVFVGFFGVRAYVHHRQTEATYQRDKAYFADAEKSIESTYDAIVVKIGQPYAHENNQSCEYSAQKFSSPSLSCGTNLRFSYVTKSLQESKNLGSDVLRLVDEESAMKRWDLGYATFGDNNREGGAFEALYKGTGNLSCGLTHDVYLPKEYNSHFQSHSDKYPPGKFVSIFSFGCAKNTPKPLYKVEK